MHSIRLWLLIGTYRETLADALLAAAGVGGRLHLAAPVEPPGITTLYVPLEDGEPFDAATLRRGVAVVLAQRAASHTVRIACGAGMNCSTTFAIAALKETEGTGLFDADSIVCHAHPDGILHMAL